MGPIQTDFSNGTCTLEIYMLETDGGWIDAFVRGEFRVVRDHPRSSNDI